MAVSTTHSWWSGSPCNLERYQPSRSIDTTRIVARPVDTDRGTTRRWLDRAIATWWLLIGPWCPAWIQNWPFLTVRAPKISKNKSNFVLHLPINTPTDRAHFTLIWTHFHSPHTQYVFFKCTVKKFQFSWWKPRFSRLEVRPRTLTPWNERPTYTCGRAVIVDTWEFDGSDRARRWFFKCPDLDPYFLVQ
jgi:hypothetical protein